MRIGAFLASSDYINWNHPLVTAKARTLAGVSSSDEEIARRCFTFVRDRIKHSWDHRIGPVTCKASEVLIHGTGYCYAKSHLLAALLRANGIRAGLCYQRLQIEPDAPGGAAYCLHGLNAVHLGQYGWYRVDPRGNKPGVAAEFCPPLERLAFPIATAAERDFPEIFAEPLPIVVEALTGSGTVEEVYANLPDAETLQSFPHPCTDR
jgi:transglutaminase-like putative cysteine protease